MYVYIINIKGITDESTPPQLVEKVVQDCWSCGEPGNPGTPLGVTLMFSSVTLLLLLLASLLRGVPIMDEMAAAKAAVKFGSEAMAAVTVSTIEGGRWLNCNGGVAWNLWGATNIGCPKSWGEP